MQTGKLNFILFLQNHIVEHISSHYIYKKINSGLKTFVVLDQSFEKRLLIFSEC